LRRGGAIRTGGRPATEWKNGGKTGLGGGYAAELGGGSKRISEKEGVRKRAKARRHKRYGKGCRVPGGGQRESALPVGWG